MSTHHIVRETPSYRDTLTLRRDIPLLWHPRVPLVTRMVNWLKGVR
jgi:hypothetical protein